MSQPCTPRTRTRTPRNLYAQLTTSNSIANFEAVRRPRSTNFWGLAPLIRVDQNPVNRKKKNNIARQRAASMFPASTTIHCGWWYSMIDQGLFCAGISRLRLDLPPLCSSRNAIKLFFSPAQNRLARTKPERAPLL